MKQNEYSAPNAQVILFLETDLITVSNLSGKGDFGEWDTEM